MTLHDQSRQVGVRDLHDRLSEHLENVAAGNELIVTRRGKPIARLSTIVGEDSLTELARRGLVTRPARRRAPKRPRLQASVSDLVAEQRR